MDEVMAEVAQENLMEKLFKDVMKSNWKEVTETYKNAPEVQEAKITISEDTALHLAVSDGKTEEALQLIDIVNSKTLEIKNEGGNTPLHLAAALGDSEVCEQIFSKNSKVTTVRNKKGETPIFLAALHGKKTTFALLHSLDQDLKHMRRDDGDTILHVTIAGEYLSKYITQSFTSKISVMS